RGRERFCKTRANACRENVEVCVAHPSRRAQGRAPQDEVFHQGATGQVLMVRRRQRVRAKRGPMTGSAPFRTMAKGADAFRYPQREGLWVPAPYAQLRIWAGTTSALIQHPLAVGAVERERRHVDLE